MNDQRKIITALGLSADDRAKIEAAWPDGADECRVTVEDGFLCARYLRSHERFERIRRITGYLVGTLDRFNDAKKAEERDRVKHRFGSAVLAILVAPFAFAAFSLVALAGILAGEV